MRAVVLVGGFGTRLRPLTEVIPKPLLPVGQRPIIEHVVETLRNSGVSEVVLALGFRPDAFVRAYPNGTCAGVRLRYTVEPEPLDTAGAIAFAAREVDIDDPFLVVNGDVLTDLDVRRLLDLHHTSGAQATIHLTPVADPSSFGVVALDGDGRVTRFVEKPAPEQAPSNLINAGTYVIDPALLERVPHGARCSVEREVFPAVAEAGLLFGLSTDDYWIDTGRPDSYRQANLDAVSGRRRGTPEPRLGPGARADGDVRDSVLGPGACVAAGATVTSSVLLPGVAVASGATVRSSILGSGARVDRAAVLEHVVLGVDAVVEAGENLRHARRPVPAPA
jgi:mannose-1-phosphate guanylyltransferase